MFEISELKGKKLAELQELAKTLGVPKYKTLKKLDLVYQLLDYQAANPTAIKSANLESTTVATETPKVEEKIAAIEKPREEQEKRPQPVQKEERTEKSNPKPTPRAIVEAKRAAKNKCFSTISKNLNPNSRSTTITLNGMFNTPGLGSTVML